jgi:D-glycero-alpha-D-manno-heptose 1-phosphate guanylyltransferase
MAKPLTTASVLAGGLGTRLRSVVVDRPKPMAEVAGRPFLEHLLQYWLNQGIKRFVLSVGYRHQQIQDHFGHSFAGCAIEYVVEPQPLGTGGGLLLCQRQFQLTDPFLLLNGDTFFAVNAVDLQGQANRHDADWGFSLFPTTDAKRYLAAELDHTGRLSFGVSNPGQGGDSVHWANGGVYWVHPRALNPFSEHTANLSLETELFPRCDRLGQVFCGLHSKASFIDIGIPEDYARAQTMLFL